MWYVPATDTVITYGQRYIHPDTGIVYGGTDYDDPNKLAEIVAVPLRVLTPTLGLEIVEWVVEDDTENPGGKIHRPVMLRIEQPSAGFDAATWETVDDESHPGDKLKRPLTTTAWAIAEYEITAKKTSVTQERSQRLEMLTVVYNGWTFQASPISVGNLTSVISALNAGIPLGENFTWRDADDIDRILTPTQLIELGALMLQATLVVYNKSWVLKDSFASITDAVEFRALDVTANGYW